MILKINGEPVAAKEDGVEFSFDLHDYFEVVHTPLLADIKYNGHTLLKGDVNLLNWCRDGFRKVGDFASDAIDYIF